MVNFTLRGGTELADLVGKLLGGVKVAGYNLQEKGSGFIVESGTSRFEIVGTSWKQYVSSEVGLKGPISLRDLAALRAAILQDASEREGL